MSPGRYRLFATILTAVFVVSESPIYGFTIHRTRDRSEHFPAVDLIADASTLLEVKTEFKRPNDIKPFEIDKDSNTDKRQSNEKYTENVINLTTLSSKSLENKSVKETDVSRGIKPYNSKYNKNQSSVLHKLLSDEKYNDRQTTTEISGSTGSSHKYEQVSMPINSKEVTTYISNPTSTKGSDVSDTTIENSKVTHHVGDPRDILTTTYFVTRDLIQDINDLTSTVDNRPYTVETEANVDLPSQSSNNFYPTIVETNIPGDPTTTTVFGPTVWTQNTSESKLVTTSDVTTRQNDDIPSSTDMEGILTSAANYQNIEDLVPSRQVDMTEKQTTEHINIDTTSTEKPQHKPGMVWSMRAGYLDYSGKTAVHETTKDNLKENVETTTDINDARNEVTNAHEADIQAKGVKNIELLKEEKLGTRNTDNIHDDANEGVKPLAVEVRTTTDTPKEMANKQPSADEKLSVQPITHEPIKNPELYTVNPNYKPMKRIDVQPAKPFVRNPDDNSWRNESISSLGIVFKPKNASKSFTEVLKNKTETVLNSLGERGIKGGIPELRERLEKIAEVRKSKKKRINKYGDTVYDSDEKDFGENNSKLKSKQGNSTNAKDEANKNETEIKKLQNAAEYYKTTNEYDSEYKILPEIDIQKFMKTTQPSPPHRFTSITPGQFFPERKLTIQYFPPRVVPKSTSSTNNYDNTLHKNINDFSTKDNLPIATVPTTPKYFKEELLKPTGFPRYSTVNKNEFVNEAAPTLPHHGKLVAKDGNYNRASYVIKHYGDFLNEAVRGDDDRNVDFAALTETPEHGVTINELAKLIADKHKSPNSNDYDYDFRKDVLNRFVENFNQNSDRFKVNFPVIYNSSVVHRKLDDNGKVVASSTAFMKRLYNDLVTKPNYISVNKPCGSHCENVTVELSPAYELHYYVPDEEEKEMVAPRPTQVPYQYRL